MLDSTEMINRLIKPLDRIEVLQECRRALAARRSGLQNFFSLGETPN